MKGENRGSASGYPAVNVMREELKNMECAGDLMREEKDILRMVENEAPDFTIQTHVLTIICC